MLRYIILTLPVLFYLRIPSTLVLSNTHFSPRDPFRERVSIKMLHTSMRAMCPAHTHLSFYKDSQHFV